MITGRRPKGLASIRPLYMPATAEYKGWRAGDRRATAGTGEEAPMSIQAILMPMFVAGRADLRAPVLDGRLALRAVRVRRRSSRRRSRLREPNWPPRVLQIANAYHNQLELPVLFYVVMLLALITETLDVALYVLCLDVRAVAGRPRLYPCDLEPARPPHRRIRRRRASRCC